VICPYGPHNAVEWNHCQPTWVKIILPESPLRETVTAEGPISLEGMFEVGYSLIAASDSLNGPIPDLPVHFFKPPRARTAMRVDRRITAAAASAQLKSVASWAVLLVGDRSEMNALAAYHRLSKKHAAILGAYQPAVVRTSPGVNTAAIWHRIRIEAGSRAAAEILCTRLRAAGGNCLVQRI
jgi:SPOR domain